MDESKAQPITDWEAEYKRRLKTGDPAMACATVGRWIRFVREKTDYCTRYPNWPTAADADHSSLLLRMLAGHDPMPEAEYLAAKKDNKV